MEGRGVTNFSVDKPSHGFTTATTEFDDALIQRGIVTTEQAMMAKGASAEEAVRLAQQKRGIAEQQQQKQQYEQSNQIVKVANEEDSDDESDEDSYDFDDDDDAFLQEYRSKRLDQMKQQGNSHSSPSCINHIGRQDWTRAVNEASADGWVLVTMVEASGDRRDRVVQELQKFSREFGDAEPFPSLLTIDAHDAIPNWPQERVPALFAYKDGVKQHEWIATRRGEFPPSKILEGVLRTWKVI